MTTFSSTHGGRCAQRRGLPLHENCRHPASADSTNIARCRDTSADPTSWVGGWSMRACPKSGTTKSMASWHFQHPEPLGLTPGMFSWKQWREVAYPHVDYHALTAVDAFSSGRLLPLQENPEVHARRMAMRRIGTEFEEKYAAMTGPRGFTRRAAVRDAAEVVGRGPDTDISGVAIPAGPGRPACGGSNEASDLCCDRAPCGLGHASHGPADPANTAKSVGAKRTTCWLRAHWHALRGR